MLRFVLQGILSTVLEHHGLIIHCIINNPHVVAVSLPKSVAPTDQSSPLNHTSIHPCSSSSPASFDGTFKSNWEAPREMGNKGGGCSDRNPRISEQLSFGSSLALDGNPMVALQVSYSRALGSESRFMEECAAAISFTNLVRIRPKPGAIEEEDPRAPTGLDIRDGIQEPHHVCSGSPTDRVQPTHLVQRDYGDPSILRSSHAEEGVAQGDYAPD